MTNARTRPGPDRDETVSGSGYGLSPDFISLSPPHSQGARGRHGARGARGRDERSDTAPLSSKLQHRTTYPVDLPEATWAQPLSREELS